jgi:hypothetical protein
MRALFRNLSADPLEVVVEPLGDVRRLEPEHAVEVLGDPEKVYEVTFTPYEIKIWENDTVSLEFGASSGP